MVELIISTFWMRVFAKCHTHVPTLLRWSVPSILAFPKYCPEVIALYKGNTQPDLTHNTSNMFIFRDSWGGGGGGGGR